MKVLVVTEKASVHGTVLDGGASLLGTLRRVFSNTLSVMQFGNAKDTCTTWSYTYPSTTSNRFNARIANADFVAQHVYEVAVNFDHIIFIHVSMHFGIVPTKLPVHVTTWSMPMLLTPSYRLSNIAVPPAYTQLEVIALQNVQQIITPSHFEKQQLTNFYQVTPTKIKVIPRGIAQNFSPHPRVLTQPLGFCSIGSIKVQKDTMALVQVFRKIKNKWPKSFLKIVGAVQDQRLYEQLLTEIKNLCLQEAIHIYDYHAHQHLPAVVQDCHIHLSLSRCETFGRTIFETLACGIPNVVLKQANAAYDYLHHKPYIKFVTHPTGYLTAIQEIVTHYNRLSAWAGEVHALYTDDVPSKLLKGTIVRVQRIIISDFDGTLYHKANNAHTAYRMAHFKGYDLKILCSARSLDDLLAQNRRYDLQADWLISHSGGVVADGTGTVLWTVPLTNAIVHHVTTQYPDCTRITWGEKILQLVLPKTATVSIISVNKEIYENKQYVYSRQASKLGAIVRLLQAIDWEGPIDAFGDSIQDAAWLTYFDGRYVMADTTTKPIQCTVS